MLTFHKKNKSNSSENKNRRVNVLCSMFIKICQNTKYKCKYKDKMLEIQMQIQREDGGIPLGSDSMARSPPPSVAITSHSLGTK